METKPERIGASGVDSELMSLVLPDYKITAADIDAMDPLPMPTSDRTELVPNDSTLGILTSRVHVLEETLSALRAAVISKLGAVKLDELEAFAKQLISRKAGPG